MALLQITEPGQEKAAVARLAGVDLGTTHSLIAIPGTEPEVLAIEGSSLLPSAVAYAPEGFRVGTSALQSAGQPGCALFTSVKRAIGLTGGDLAGANLPFQLVGNPADPARIAVPGVEAGLLPEQISAEVLRVLAVRAERHLGGPLDGIVLTVPAYFSESQRQASVRAANLAGLEVVRLISEPTAAALAYGLDSLQTGIIVVYDLGGGTFDCSVLQLEDGIFEVLSTAGDVGLGGDDLDFALAAEVLADRGLELQALDAAERAELLKRARDCKEALSGADSASLTMTLAGSKCERTFAREDLAKLARPLLKRTIALCRRALRDAGLELDQVDEWVLVGGATRMPVLREQVQAFFGRPLQTGLDPDQVVVRGAAMQARALAFGGNLLVDVTPLSLGIETLGGLTEVILPRNSTIPAVAAKEFTTAKDGQTALSVHVVQGERPLASECRSLAHFSLSGIPPMAAGSARIRISFRMDESGLLSVRAREQVSGVEARVSTDRGSAFAEGEIRQLLERAEACSQSDDALKRQRETATAAGLMLEHLESALETDATLLNEAEQQRLLQAMAALKSVLDADGDEAALRQAIEALSGPADDFAAKRMDATVRTALTGTKLEELTQ